jgi:hypothetical protein
MQLTLIITENCEACDRAKLVIHKFKQEHPCVQFETIDVNSYTEREISITPALLINRKLFSYGDIDTERLSKKLS